MPPRFSIAPHWLSDSAPAVSKTTSKRRRYESDVEGAIIDDLAHAQRQRFLASGRAATADDVCAAHARDLHRRTSNPAQTPGDEDRLASAQPCLRHQRVPGRQAHYGQGGGLLEREGWRLEPDVFFVGDDVFGERARLTDGGDAEDFIAHLEPLHPRPDGFDHAGEIMAQAARKPEPGNRLHLAPANFPVHRVGGRSPDLNANLARPAAGPAVRPRPAAVPPGRRIGDIERAS